MAPSLPSPQSLPLSKSSWHFRVRTCILVGLAVIFVLSDFLELGERKVGSRRGRSSGSGSNNRSGGGGRVLSSGRDSDGGINGGSNTTLSSSSSRGSGGSSKSSGSSSSSSSGSSSSRSSSSSSSADAAAATTAPAELSSEEERLGYRYEVAHAQWRPRAVKYRGGLWKPHVGRWLAQCGGESDPVDLEEPLLKERCRNKCGGRGSCDHALGVCRCPHGYNGSDCTGLDDYPCNMPPVPGLPLGPPVYSICAAVCDRRMARCVCGERSPYPNRPTVEPCGFNIHPQRGPQYNEVNTTHLYDHSNPRKMGWCFADPEQVEKGRQKIAQECYNNYDGAWGMFSDIPTMTFCINQCTSPAHGKCISGFCKCRNGWYGTDCSIPSGFTRTSPASSRAATKFGQMPPEWMFSTQRLSHGSSSRSSNDPVAADEADTEDDLAAASEAQDGNLDTDADVDVKSSSSSGGSGDVRGGARAAEPSPYGSVGMSAQVDTDEGVIRRKTRRPLVYVYELPLRFTSNLVAGRYWKHNCVPRLYDFENKTETVSRWFYSSEIMFYEGLLASPHRTTNPDEADYFFVPLLGACLMGRADDSPEVNLAQHSRGNPEAGVRPTMMADWALEVLGHIQMAYPFWNRTDGRDHIWMFVFDEGACYAPQAIWNSIMLTPWGNTGARHSGSTTAYAGDVWTKTPVELRGHHPCYDPAKDIVIPSLKDPNSMRPEFRWRPYSERVYLYYFRGNLGLAFPFGRPEPRYSMGIRQRVAHFFASSKNLTGHVGVKSEEDVRVENGGSHKYDEELSQSVFCGVFPGDGFSARMEDAILHGCIPVIVQDGILLPFEAYLDYESFAVRIREDDIPHMIAILRTFPKSRVTEMLDNVRAVQQRWFYSSVVGHEVWRQMKKQPPNVVPWADNVRVMDSDDAVDTVMQILHYKLHNDKWRQQSAKQNTLNDERSWGVGPQCTSPLTSSS